MKARCHSEARVRKGGLGSVRFASGCTQTRKELHETTADAGFYGDDNAVRYVAHSLEWCNKRAEKITQFCRIAWKN